MQYIITKLYMGNIEMNLSNRTIKLTLENPQCIVDEDEYEEILSKHESLILNNLIFVKRLVEEIEELEVIDEVEESEE